MPIIWKVEVLLTTPQFPSIETLHDSKVLTHITDYGSRVITPNATQSLTYDTKIHHDRTEQSALRDRTILSNHFHGPKAAEGQQKTPGSNKK